MDITPEKKELILARLKLAQALLEDSDRLTSIFSDETLDQNKPWLHPRHEREAVVVYLLLTCFDILGQKERFLTFTDWINSKKEKHKSERSIVFSKVDQSDIDSLTVCKMLCDEYNEIYGMTNSFYKGIESFPDSERNKILESITVVDNPEYGKYGLNTSTPGQELADKEQERKMKLKYIFSRRNKFTHSLDQHHTSSSVFPILGGTYDVGVLDRLASWGAIIKDDLSVGYYCYHSDIEFSGKYERPKSTYGAFCYTVMDWPFILFDVIYSAIGVDFKRTSIKLLFKVEVNIDGKRMVFDGIPHAEFEDVPAFLKKLNY